MFELIRFTLEKVFEAVGKILQFKHDKREAVLGREMLNLLEEIQRTYTSGTKILDIVDAFAGLRSSTEPHHDLVLHFDALVQEQISNIQTLQATLIQLQQSILTVDGDLAFGLEPFLDRKSGLLTKLRQESRVSPRSTTFLFYLDRNKLSDPLLSGLIDDDSRKCLAEQVNSVRTIEVRDVTRMTESGRERLVSFLSSRNPRLELEELRRLAKDFHTKLDSTIGLKLIRSKERSS